MTEVVELKGWHDWYRFARSELGLLHEECVEYANLRYVEEQNRVSMRARGASAAAELKARDTRPT